MNTNSEKDRSYRSKEAAYQWRSQGGRGAMPPNFLDFFFLVQLISGNLSNYAVAAYVKK